MAHHGAGTKRGATGELRPLACVPLHAHTHTHADDECVGRSPVTRQSASTQRSALKDFAHEPRSPGVDSVLKRARMSAGLPTALTSVSESTQGSTVCETVCGSVGGGESQQDGGDVSSWAPSSLSRVASIGSATTFDAIERAFAPQLLRQSVQPSHTHTHTHTHAIPDTGDRASHAPYTMTHAAYAAHADAASFHGGGLRRAQSAPPGTYAFESLGGSHTHTHTHAAVEAVETVDESLADDGAASDHEHDYLLPTLPRGSAVKTDIPTIHHDTMCQLMRGDYDDRVERVIIIDCRYPYEYAGGHIKDALNADTAHTLRRILFDTPPAGKRYPKNRPCSARSGRGSTTSVQSGFEVNDPEHPARPRGASVHARFPPAQSPVPGEGGSTQAAPQPTPSTMLARLHIVTPSGSGPVSEHNDRSVHSRNAAAGLSIDTAQPSGIDARRLFATHIIGDTPTSASTLPGSCTSAGSSFPLTSPAFAFNGGVHGPGTFFPAAPVHAPTQDHGSRTMSGSTIPSVPLSIRAPEHTLRQRAASRLAGQDVRGRVGTLDSVPEMACESLGVDEDGQPSFISVAAQHRMSSFALQQLISPIEGLASAGSSSVRLDVDAANAFAESVSQEPHSAREPASRCSSATSGFPPLCSPAPHDLTPLISPYGTAIPIFPPRPGYSSSGAPMAHVSSSSSKGEPIGPEKRTVVILHCEYSINRGPRMWRLARRWDRQHNTRPSLCYPDMYLLHQGYHKFFEHHETFCAPQGYTRMDDTQYACHLKEARLRSRESYDDVGASDLGEEYGKKKRRPSRYKRGTAAGDRDVSDGARSDSDSEPALSSLAPAIHGVSHGRVPHTTFFSRSHSVDCSTIKSMPPPPLHPISRVLFSHSDENPDHPVESSPLSARLRRAPRTPSLHADDAGGTSESDVERARRAELSGRKQASKAGRIAKPRAIPVALGSSVLSSTAENDAVLDPNPTGSNTTARPLPDGAPHSSL